MAMYDSSLANPQLYSAPNPTILFFTSVPVSATAGSSAGSLTAVYRSMDLGSTFSVPTTVPFSSEFVIAVSNSAAALSGPLSVRQYMNVLVDLNNNVYSYGYSNSFNIESDPTVWLSRDKAQTFSVMQLNPSTWTGRSAALEAYAWQYGCSALQYGASSSGQQVPQLVSYGGLEYISDGTLVSMTQANVLNVNATNVDAALPQLTLAGRPDHRVWSLLSSCFPRLRLQRARPQRSDAGSRTFIN